MVKGVVEGEEVCITLGGDHSIARGKSCDDNVMKVCCLISEIWCFAIASTCIFLGKIKPGFPEVLHNYKK